ncbi:MAG: hypothetical protein JWQ51_2520 [Tardiphaga sp.]|nr:hypothetical protein [Tardiphaga sp.]
MDDHLRHGRRVSPPPGSPLIADAAAFIRANTVLQPVPLVPEIVLYLADETVPLWTKTEDELGEAGLPPPFWAFAWAGGQALARYVLDHSDIVRGKTVLDLASGSGLVGIAACKAGAARVIAADIDAFARAACVLNAQSNDVTLESCHRNLLADAIDHLPVDIVLAGDIFYERDTAALALTFLTRRRARGTLILIGDPGRSFLPKDSLRELAIYQVPVTRELEDMEIRRTSVWTLA